MTTFNGLPAHTLLVHLTVVVVPVAALLGIVVVVWPAARRTLGLAPAVIGLVAVVAVPLTTSAGEWLEKRTPPSRLVERHAELGDQMIGWMAPLFVFLVLWWALHSERLLSHLPTLPGRAHRVAEIVIGLAVLITAVGALVMIYRIGDSGAQAVWHDR